MKNILLICFYLCFYLNVYPQTSIDTSDQHPNTKTPDYSARKWLIGSSTTLAYGGSFIFLNEAWYKDYPRSSFHFYNDSGEWLQVDKVGHSWTAYHTSRLTSAMWQWAGVPANKAVWLGTGSSLLYMFSIEYLDGLSREWGWSWADVGANLLGGGLFAAQQLKWNEQKVQFKFSSWSKQYSDDLKSRVDKLYGKSYHGRLLKDYNAQTYWLSANMKSIFPGTGLPEWLNISIGYGADNMFGGYENIAYDENGTIVFDRRDIPRHRQWYLSPDVDLTRIKTKSKFLKTVLTTVNVLKFPAPSLEFYQGRFTFRPLHF